MSFSDVVASLLADGIAVRFRARGASMEPSIADGELVTIERIDPEAAHVGDVVVYSDPYRLRAHRMIRKGASSHSLICQGDSQGFAPEEVEPSRVVGVVAGVGNRLRAPKRRHLRAAYLFVRGFAAKMLKY